MFKVTAGRTGVMVEQNFDELHTAIDKFKELAEQGFECTIKRLYWNEKAAWIIH